MKKPDSVVLIPGDLNTFFRNWLEFLKPFHGLTGREMDLAAALIRHRYELSKVIKDSDILDRETLGEVTKKKILDDFDMSPPHYYALIGKLRKNKVIIGDKINPRFIPNIPEDSDNFKLLVSFKLK